jgi:hypothetical protein
MIIYLKGADFSKHNIGTLDSWRISRSLGSGATYEGPTSVDKDAALTATVTLAEGYEVGTAGVTITMGGTVLSGAHTMVGNVITITIASVTGNVLIKVPTINMNTGEEDDPETPETPDSGDIPPIDPSLNYLLNIDFVNTPSSELIGTDKVFRTDANNESIAYVQDSNGLKLNGRFPYGFQLVNTIQIPEKWCVEYCVKYPTYDKATMPDVTPPAAYAMLGSNAGLAPVILMDGSQTQVRFKTGDTPRVDSATGYNLMDSNYHTYKIECIGNYQINYYRDGAQVGSTVSPTQGTPGGRGTWERLLGTQKAWIDQTNSGNYKTDGDGYLKYIRVWSV